MNREIDGKKEAETSSTDSMCCSPVRKDEEQLADCCGAGSQDGNANGRLTSKIKTVIFIVVVLAAVGVAVSAVLKKNDLPAIIETDDCSKADPTDRGSSVPGLASLPGLDTVAPDKDFVFIFLPGPGGKNKEKAAGVVDQTSEILSRRGILVANVTIKPESPDYQTLIEVGEISSFPAVLAIGKGKGSVIVTGEITEEKLMAAYLRAARPAACNPDPCCAKK